MRAGIYRILRAAVVAGAAYLAYRWLAPEGLGWVVLVVTGLAAVGFIGWRVWRLRRARAQEARADRWAEALMFPPRRPAAVAELREILAGSAGRRPEEHARHALVLAELLEADGAPAAALEVLSEVDTAALPSTLAAIVHHARAVAYLSAGDAEAARAALDEAAPGGDVSVALRVRMLRGVIAAELGDHAEARRIAEAVRDEVAEDEDLAVEARVLDAVRLDAAGDRLGALERMARLGDDVLDVLAVLGLPRVRGLAADAIAARE